MALPNDDAETNQVPETGNGIPVAVFVFPAAIFLVLVAMEIFSFGSGSAGSWVSLLICAGVIWLLGIYDLLREERMGTPEKILWMLVFMALNAIGTLFYLLLKQRYVRPDR